MTPERNALIEEINDLHQKMREHAVRQIHNQRMIQEETWDRFLRNIEIWSFNRLKYVNEFLNNIYQNEWWEIHAVWTKPNINEEMWENYEWMFDHRDVLEEQKMLTRARKAFKKRWVAFRKNYAKFKADERAAKKTATQTGA